MGYLNTKKDLDIQVGMPETRGMTTAAEQKRAESKVVKDNYGFVVKIATRYARWGVPVDDLIQEGLIGLLLAFRRWDPSAGASLRTWARFKICAQMRELIGRDRRTKTSGGLRRREMHASLDAPLRDQGGDVCDGTLHDVTGTPPTQEDELAAAEGASQIRASIERLAPRAKSVIKARFGEELSLHVIADRFGLSPQRIHQIEADALDELGKRLKGAAA